MTYVDVPGSVPRRRLRRLAVALLTGTAVGFLVFVAGSQGLRTARGGRIGGDLPAFYGAARIVRSGHTHDLYDPRTQQESQRDLFPPGIQGRVAFAYPPFVALAYVPATWLPFKGAYAVHTLLMALCVVLGLGFVWRVIPQLQSSRLAVVAAGMVFYPIFRAILGGQNTAVSLLCAAAAASAMARGRDLLAGVWMGVWFFKPQLALPVAMALVLRATNKARFIVGVGLVCGAYYLIGAALAGWAWPVWWWQQGVMPFASADIIVDRANGISFPELGVELGVTSMGWMAAALTVALAFWIAWGKRHPIAVTAFATGAAVLAAPHALYYDGGLAALALIASVGLCQSVLAAVSAVWLLAWLQPLRPYFPLPPMTIVVILSMCLVGAISARSNPGPTSSR